MQSPLDPRAEYETRAEKHRVAERLLTRRQNLIANLRLAVFAVSAGLVWVAARGNPELIPWLALPLILFVALVLAHLTASKRSKRAKLAVAIYERGLANLDDRWAGTGDPGLEFLDPHHPFSEDLDLFGVGSIFERICTARTRTGRKTLADWLLHPSDVAGIQTRQAAVIELTNRIELREDLSILSGDLEQEVDPARVVAWAESPPVIFQGFLRLVALVLAMATLGLLVAWLIFGLSARPFIALVILELIYSGLLYRKVAQAIDGVERQAEHLAVLSALLRRIESESFQSPRLVSLRDALDPGAQRPSVQLARLARLVDLLEARKNQMFMPFAWMMLWSTQIAFALAAWRTSCGHSVARWFQIAGEFEALCSLAGFAFENPGNTYPEVVDVGPIYEGKSLGHPLIPAAKCIRNDVSLGGSLRVLVVSGSNMSGKSTLLRTVGANAVLALAGSPVRAERLVISPIALGATLRVRDSLQEGHSRFYAELVRLKQLVDLARGPTPLLFLLDEILHGTNSHDRRQGAEAVVRGLVDLGAIGLVTTHDLALADVASRLGDRALNVHFADQFDQGVMTFDYKMQPGVVRHSNAIALMRAVGLDVPEGS